MEPLEAIDIGRDALWVLLRCAMPLLFVALFVGLAVALFQALTQIQEMTLTFIPKIISVFLVLMLIMPYIFNTLKDFTEQLESRIVQVE